MFILLMYIASCAVYDLGSVCLFQTGLYNNAKISVFACTYRIMVGIQSV